MMSYRLLSSLAMLCLAAVYLVPATLRPVSITDEARYGEIPREMVARGDWVVPRMNGLRYFEKPVLGYWATAVAMKMFGVNPFSIRFSSVLSAGLTALMIAMWIRRTLGDRDIALLAAVVFATSFLVFAVGETALLDMVFTLCLTGTLVFFFFSVHESVWRRKAVLLAICGVFCGMSFLTKGFIAFAVPTVVAVPYLLWERRWRDLFTLPWIPLLVIVAISLPWAIAIHIREPDFWRYFFWVEHVNRYFAGEEAQHPYPSWYFVPVLIGGAVPWSMLWPAAWKGLASSAPRHRSLRRFAMCWLALPFLFFSASSGKLGTYILPCFPALALLTGWGLLAYFRLGLHTAFNRGAWVLAAIVGSAGAGLFLVQAVGPKGWQYYTPEETIEWVGLSAAFVLWAGLCVLAARAKNFRTKLVAFCLGPMPVLLSMVWQPVALSATRSADEFLDLVADRVPENGILVSDSTLVHATCLYFQRDDVYLMRAWGELKYGLEYEDAKGRYMQEQEFLAMIEANRGGPPITVIMEHKRFEPCRAVLPSPTFEQDDTRFESPSRLMFLQFGGPEEKPTPMIRSAFTDEQVRPYIFLYFWPILYDNLRRSEANGMRIEGTGT